MTNQLQRLRVPIVQAPLAGGASTPALAAAVAGAGGLGFLAAGYKSPVAVADEIRALRGLTAAAFGVNVFAPPAPPASSEAVAAYAAQLQTWAERLGVALGPARHDDDDFEAKVALVADAGVAVVSFTFGLPARTVLDRLHGAGCEVWVTVTSPAEALAAAGAGADALIVQGFEAGGHRGYFVDSDQVEDLGLLVLLRLVADVVALPLVAAGGIADGAAVAAVLAAGATAAQVGSALMLTPEAGTSPPYRAALHGGGQTALTRAFSGRQARGIVNQFMLDYDGQAPIAYPAVHHMTTPLRAAARDAGNADAINLWAGQAHKLAREAPAAEVIARLAAEAEQASQALLERLRHQ